MKKISKSLIALLMVMLIIGTCSTVFADDYFSGLEGTVDADSGIFDLGSTVIDALTTAGIVISVIILIVLGFKYMIGSAEEKADYKKSFIPYIVGAILIFAASTVASMIYNFIGTSA